MSIITISRGSYSKGKQIAEKVAQRLGYECLSRDVLIEASQQFNVPEVKLVKAIHDAPGILDRFTPGKKRYVAYIRAALLRHFARDRVVYHGLAGHFFVQHVPHVLRVRVTADLEERVRLEIEREGIGREEAKERLVKDDEERRRWAVSLYGIDTADPSLYDMVLHIQRMGVDEAVEVICAAVQMECFRTTGESRARLDDLRIVADAQAALVEAEHELEVCADNGVVHLVPASERVNLSDAEKRRIEAAIKDVEGVKGVAFHEGHESFSNPWYRI